MQEVLPALVPELSYEEMEIGDGGMAMLSYLRMCDSKDPDEVAGHSESPPRIIAAWIL